jgi:peptidoglycan/xylan/chitin deacetylase (PgdA/CDA1 family)
VVLRNSIWGDLAAKMDKYGAKYPEKLGFNSARFPWVTGSRSIASMKRRKRCRGLAVVLGGLLSLAVGCDRPEPPAAETGPPPEPLEEVDLIPVPMEIDPSELAPIIDKTAKVTILGYHQFITSGSPGEMKIQVPKFREQMLALKTAGIPVISLSDYMAWRKGEKPVPERCVVITIDDGYSDIHSHALPIFREFGYPFTFYIYTNFLGGGGRTMTDEQVMELIAAGGELGSHSISHDFLHSAKKKLGDRYEAWLEDELKGSKDALERRFGVEVNSFAYPYGQYNSDLAAKVESYGYTSAVTVNGAKCGFGTAAMELPRYIIHGNNDSNWGAGTNFSGGGGLADSNNLLSGKGEGDAEIMVRVWPEAGSVVADRLPTIWADLSKLEGVDPASVVMKVGGFGVVPSVFNPATGVVSWTVARRLRGKECTVSLSMKRAGERKADFARWSFAIDRTAYYLPDYEKQLSARGAAAAGAVGKGAGDGKPLPALPVE